MVQGTLVLSPGTLWRRVLESTAHAIQCGALQSIPTKYEFVAQAGVKFVVRSVSNLARKDELMPIQATRTSTGEGKSNPFLPYDTDLFVADISATHLCLLNKFNVFDHHLLVVTRLFEEQESLLTLSDFEALWACMAEFDGLAFYNAGKIAGASQRHKHLQIVPLPLATSGPAIPVESVLTVASSRGPLAAIPRLPFVHALTRVDPKWMDSPRIVAERTRKRYLTMLHAVNLADSIVDGMGHRLGPYNLLVTRRWMLMVPRTKERCRSISVNALGFAGAFLVASVDEMQAIKDQGPMTVLEKVAVKRGR